MVQVVIYKELQLVLVIKKDGHTVVGQKAYLHQMLIVMKHKYYLVLMVMIVMIIIYGYPYQMMVLLILGKLIQVVMIGEK